MRGGVRVGRFRSRIGLGYLRQGDFTVEGHQGEALPARFSGETVLAYGLPILKTLKAAPKERERVHKIIDQTRIPMETCLTVTQALSQLGYLTIGEKDLKGNHLLHLTEKGRKMVEG